MLATTSSASTTEIRRPGPGHEPSEVRVLSIDMGIRNLAYAVLQCHNGHGATELPVLSAWDRLAITPSAPKAESHIDSAPSESLQYIAPFLAPPAYEFIRNALQYHRPTHILIEHQRFRSGGSSAVQEWSLRVGMFEAMLHSILYTLSRERPSSDWGVKDVQMVDPGRVGRYWESRLGLQEDQNPATKTPKARKKAKEGKQMKIDLVGRWLTMAQSVTLEDATSSCQELDLGVRFGQKEGSVSVFPPITVEAYLHQWTRKTRPKARSKLSKDEALNETFAKLPKLDDLADSLVQAVTWLKWQQTKSRITQRGYDAQVSLS